MATSFLCKFVAANLQGDGSYIMSSSDDETPDAFDWEVGDTDNAIATPGGTWPAGEPVLDHTPAASVLSSTDAALSTAFPEDSMRVLITFEVDSDPGNYNFFRWETAGSDNLVINWRTATPTIRVDRNNNGGSGLAQWESGTLAVGTAYALEIRIDTTEGVDNDVMQARIWAIGGAAGSLTSSTEAGTAGASASFNLMESSTGSGNFTKIGRIIVDDDPDTDLSGFDESYPGGAAANPKGPLGHPLYGPFRGPIG